MSAGPGANMARPQVRQPTTFFPTSPLPNQDWSDARRYGRPVFMTEGRGISLDGSGIDAARARMEEQLAAFRFDPEIDFVVLSGPILHLCILVALVARMHCAFRVLIFDANTSRYVLRRFSAADATAIDQAGGVGAVGVVGGMEVPGGTAKA